MSTIYCRAERDTQLVAAQVDALSSGHVYGLSTDGYVFVFKTSNLLQNPEASECFLDTKFRVANKATDMATVKGGIIVKTDQGSLFLNASTFMVNRHTRSAVYELPKPVVCPFSTNIHEFKTTHTSLLLTENMEIYELMIPYIKKEEFSAWSLEGMRFPLILLSFGSVAVYQLFIKRSAYFKSRDGPPSSDGISYKLRQAM